MAEMAVGRVKQIAADFMVTECPNVQPAARGRYRVFRLRKQGYTTFEAIAKLAVRMGVEQHDLSYAGLKDEDGITEQLVGCDAAVAGDFPGFVEDTGDRTIDVLAIGFSDEPIRVGELHGNIFSVVVRDLDSTRAKTISALCRSDHYFANYYDTQRFGTPNGPKTTHVMGQALSDGQFDEAFVLLRASRAPEAAGARDWEGTAMAFFASLDQRTVAFYLSSHESAVWNRHLRTLATEVLGDTSEVTKHGHVYALPLHSGRALQLAATSRMLPYRRHRWDRDLGIKAEDCSRATVVQTRMRCTVSDDDLYSGQTRVTLRFFLPSGSYATMAIDHLLSYADAALRQPSLLCDPVRAQLSSAPAALTER